jgi:hypothetical protein
VAWNTPDGVLDFHSLRGAFAVLLENDGVGLSTAQKLMRHSDPELTANVYQSLEFTELATALEMINGTANELGALVRLNPTRPESTKEDDRAVVKNVVTYRALRSGTDAYEHERPSPKPEGPPTQLVAPTALGEITPRGLEPPTYGLGNRRSPSLGRTAWISTTVFILVRYACQGVAQTSASTPSGHGRRNAAPRFRPPNKSLKPTPNTALSRWRVPTRGGLARR